MPKCSQCGESAAFHELTNYAVPASPGETTERLCFRCIQIERLQARDSQSIAKVAELLAELKLVEEAMPKTFYAHLPIAKRVEKLAENWNKLISMCQIFEEHAETDAKSLLQFADERKVAISELERVKAQCAVMRIALERADKLAPTGSGAEKMIRDALATDAGRDYVAKEKVKPLVEALQRIEAYGDTFAHTQYAQNPYEQVTEALAVAKELGS